MYVRITRGGRQRDISRLTMTLLGPPRARLQQAGTLPPMYRYIHRRITSAVAGQGMLVYKGGKQTPVHLGQPPTTIPSI